MTSFEANAREGERSSDSIKLALIVLVVLFGLMLIGGGIAVGISHKRLLSLLIF